MTEYHVKLDDKTGKINAGTFTKEGKWNHKSEVTEETLQAARDHLLYLSKQEGKDIAFTWAYDNGMSLILKLEAKKSEEIKAEEDAGVSQD